VSSSTASSPATPRVVGDSALTNARAFDACITGSGLLGAGAEAEGGGRAGGLALTDSSDTCVARGSQVRREPGRRGRL